MAVRGCRRFGRVGNNYIPLRSVAHGCAGLQTVWEGWKRLHNVGERCTRLQRAGDGTEGCIRREEGAGGLGPKVLCTKNGPTRFCQG